MTAPRSTSHPSINELALACYATSGDAIRHRCWSLCNSRGSSQPKPLNLQADSCSANSPKVATWCNRYEDFSFQIIVNSEVRVVQ